ncbi:MAG: 3-hydroxyacyl-CoA dehydrogenase NAD-binding domain-containing protein [Pseudomonadota bacterium]
MGEGPVTIERVGAVGLVRIDNPPVNAASQAVRLGLDDAVRALDADHAVGVIALYGADRTFIAGADIREFGKPPLAPILPDVCNTIENSHTPVVAVLHGTTLGGGLEVALACRARVALAGTTVGLPEVSLGIFPGAGGTQRTPRLTGMKAALDLITSGRRVGAEEAKSLGIIDQIRDGEPREVAVAAAADVQSGALPVRRTGELPVVTDEEALQTTAETLKKNQPHLLSPLKAVDAVAASARPLAEGLAIERALFMECLDSPQRAGLVHAFFAERAVAKIPEAGATARPVNSVGVVGGGTMGSGIATAALLAGLKVTLVERDDDSAQKARGTVLKNLDGAVARKKLSADARQRIEAEYFAAKDDLATLADVDLVIEAVFEDMAVKKELFGRLDGIAKDGAILASNTSYLDLNEIASVTGRPQDVIGLHFFSPAHIMRLLEVVVGDKTTPEVVATGFALAKRLRKVAVRAGVCDGFIGNRILSHYRKVTEYMVLDGASPQQVDEALEAYGFAMGPFAVADLAGIDISWAERKRRAPMRPPQERYSRISDRLCEVGAFGRKAGRGYYLYDGGARKPNPEALAIVEDERDAAGIALRDFTAEEIVNQYLTAMICEAARVVEDGTALRPIDVDAVYLFGYGFPRFRGGPLHTADVIGAETLVARIKKFSGEDAHYWQVPKILAAMASAGTTFAERNESG